MNHKAGLNSDNVRVGVTGAVYVAPRHTQPAGDDGFGTIAGAVNLGYLNEDGLTEANEASSEELIAWQDGDVVRSLSKDRKVTYTAIFIETKREVLELYYNSELDESDGSIMVGQPGARERKTFIFDVIDGSDAIRIYCPDAAITEIGEQVYANEEPIGYEVTITAYETDIGGKRGCARKYYNSMRKKPRA